MQRYKAFTPGMQVRGRVIQAAVRCLNSEHLEPYLRQNGLLGRQDDLQPILPDRWYSQQDWLNVLNALVEESGSSSMSDLVSVGMTLANLLCDPADAGQGSLEEQLEAWGRAYQEQHRDGDAGELIVHRMGSKLIWVDTRTAYPDEILYGAIYAIASRYFPDRAAVTVRYDNSLPRRDQGGAVTRYMVSWT